MNKQLDVLVLDDRPEALETQRVLQGAGHRVHRCRPLGDGGFACDGIRTGRRCPLDGSIDVALITRGRTDDEMPDGTRCAIRAGVPIVEQSSQLADEFDPEALLIIHRPRPGESIVSACVRAVEAAKVPLTRAIAERIRPVLDAARISPDAVRTDIEWDGAAVIVQVSVPAPSTGGLEQALAVRILDAVRANNRTYGQVNVRVQSLDE